MTKNRLPDKPSELIRLAVADMDKVHDSKGYKLDMRNWHTGDVVGSTCYVCAAGSIMAKTLNVKQKRFTDPVEMFQQEEIDEDTYGKLIALDSFRRGNIQTGLHSMRIELPKDVPSNYEIPHFLKEGYDYSLVGYYETVKSWPTYNSFRKAMLTMADKLECSGL